MLQRLVLALWRDPAVTELVQRAAQSYEQRRDGLLAALAERGLTAHGRSGINVWLPVADETSTVTALRDAGWAVAPGALYRIAAPPGPAHHRQLPGRRRPGPPGRRPGPRRKPTPLPRLPHLTHPSPRPPAPRSCSLCWRNVGPVHVGPGRKCKIARIRDGGDGYAGARRCGDMASGGARKGIWIAVAVAIIIIIIVLIAIASGGDGGGNGY